MKTEMLTRAIELAKEVGLVLVATADKAGCPHLAAAGEMADAKDRHLSVGAWFCPQTVANLKENPKVSLIVWDERCDEGFQLVGELADLADTAVLDGYSPQVERTPPPPQIKRRLIVRVDKVIRFSQAPHSDEEE